MDEGDKTQKLFDDLVKIITSFEALEKSREWEILKELVFSKSQASIERQIQNAATESPVDLPKLYKLQGELSWAKRFNNIDNFVDSYKKQLIEIKKKI